MKITVDIDCTPDEARAFLGLPDVRAFQAAVMAQFQERVGAALQGMDADALVRTWVPGGLQGMEQFTKTLFSQFEAALGGEQRK